MAAASSFGSYVATFGPHVAPIRSLLGHIALLSGVTPPTWVLPHWEVDVANSEKCSPDTQNLYLSVGGIISLGIGGGVSKAIGPSLNNFAPGIHSRWGRAHRLPPSNIEGGTCLRTGHATTLSPNELTEGPTDTLSPEVE